MLDEHYDLNSCEADFIENLNDIATDREVTHALLEAYAKKEIVRGTPENIIFDACVKEAGGVLPGAHINAIIEQSREELVIRQMARKSFSLNRPHAETKAEAYFLAKHIEEDRIKLILREELNAYRSASALRAVATGATA